MLRITLYVEKDCPPCERALADLEAVGVEIPHDLVVVDVDTNADLRAAYGARVPVLETGPYKLQGAFDRQKIRMTLGAARDRMEQKKAIDGKSYEAQAARAQSISRSERFTYGLAKHYLLYLNLLVFIYVGLPFLAPVLMNAGLPSLARPIYSVYGAVCHQFAFRSWFLFGEQPVYPRTAAGLEGLTPYGEATGLGEEDLFAARDFIGNEQVGYKVAYCQRDVAIYGSMLLFGLVFAATGRKLRALPWYVWVAVGIAPIGLDGFSQLLSQLPNFTMWAYRESTPLLRTLTGSLFGFITAWFGYPLIEEAMADTRKVLAAKMARVEKATVGK